MASWLVPRWMWDPGPSNPPRIFLRPARVTQLLGVELPWQALEGYLVAIGATVVSKPEDGRIAVEAPSWRPDLLREVDLIEEVARLHGYEKFPAELRPFRPGLLPDAPIERATDEVRRGMARQGFFEVSPLPTGPADGPDSVRLLNPLSKQMATCGGASCLAWCAWSRATGPSMSPTCACSRSAPSSPPRPAASGRGKSVTWPVS